MVAYIKINHKQNTMKISKGVWIVIAVAVLVGGAAFFALQNGKVVAPANENYETAVPASVPAAPAAQTPPPSSTGKVVTVNVVGSSFAYNPSVIRVKKGDTVKINYTDSDGFHDLVIDGYNLRTERITPGQSSSLEFVADQTGQFAYYCSVGNHRAAGMQGTLIVE